MRGIPHYESCWQPLVQQLGQPVWPSFPPFDVPSRLLEGLDVKRHERAPPSETTVNNTTHFLASRAALMAACSSSDRS